MRESTEHHLMLYLAGELDAEAQASVERLLVADPEARAFVEDLQAIQAQAAEPLPEAVVDTLPALEARIAHAVRTGASSRAGWWSWIHPERGAGRVWATRLAVATVLIAAGFGLGRLGGGLPALQPGVAPEALLAQAAQLEDTYFGGVSDMRVDPASGHIEVHYQTVSERVARGLPSDPAIAALLEGALLDADNPAGRLDALQTLVSTAREAPAPDPQIVGALVTVLVEEPNEGLRLQALRALGVLHADHTFGETAKATVIGVMLDDTNPALRMEALQLLTQNATRTADLAPYLEAATADTNTFIQLKAERLLDRLNDTNFNPNR